MIQIQSILANIFTIGGVIFFHWDLKMVLMGFWLENIVIVRFNIMKIWKAEKYSKNTNKIDITKTGEIKTRVSTPKRKVALIGFFIIHYGIFCAAHLVFINVLAEVASGNLWAPKPPNDLMQFVPLLFFYAIYHLKKFNIFMDKKVFKNTSPEEQMVKVYKRIMLIHFAIIGTMFIIMPLSILGIIKNPILQIALVIAVKLGMDYYEDKIESNESQ